MQTPTPYKFKLGQQASIAVSGETGQIIARAEYTTGTNSYLLRYKSADGRAVEAWWNEDAVALDNSLAASSADHATSPSSTTLPKGERYAGIVLDADGKPTHHLVLMAQRPEEDLNWQAAMDWAASIGGTLPTRQEQALLYANCKPNLKPEWHWSCEEHKDDASCAWVCNFGNGLQYITLKSYEGSVVAVRRLPLQSFNPLV